MLGVNKSSIAKRMVSQKKGKKTRIRRASGTLSCLTVMPDLLAEGPSYRERDGRGNVEEVAKYPQRGGLIRLPVVAVLAFTRMNEGLADRRPVDDRERKAPSGGSSVADGIKRHIPVLNVQQLPCTQNEGNHNCGLVENNKKTRL